MNPLRIIYDDKIMNFVYYFSDKNELLSTVRVFDKLLDEYGDIVGQLETLLDKLSAATDRANQNMSDYEINNQKLKKFNKKLDSRLEAMYERLKDLEEEFHNLNDSTLDHGLFKENIDVPSTTVKHLDEVEKKLKSWQDFVEKNNKESLADDIMNIPYSVSDDITFLETILAEEKEDTDCLEEIQQDLKTLFEELSTLLNFNSMSDEMKQISKMSDVNRKSAEDLLNDTQNILKKELQLFETYERANETVKLAEEIEALKDEINNLRQKKPNNGTIDLTNLNKLLQQLKKFEIIDFNIEEVEEEIYRYQTVTDCYLQYIDGCHIKKAADNVSLPECVKC
nr:protein SGM1-like isoform X1 [Leptinotarsa decemlineata]